MITTRRLLSSPLGYRFLGRAFPGRLSSSSVSSNSSSQELSGLDALLSGIVPPPPSADPSTTTAEPSSTDEPSFINGEYQPSEYAQAAIARYQKNKNKHTDISFFVNILMKSGGDRLKVEKCIASGLHLIHKRSHQDPERLFARALDMLSPRLDVRSYKSGAKLIRVPIPLTDYRARTFAFRWLKETLNSHTKKRAMPRQNVDERFANEILAILEGKSSLLQKKAQMHREALTNRTSAKFRWAVGYSF